MNNFPDVVINKILSFISHPCADLVRQHFRLIELCGFDGVNEWWKTNSLYGYTMIGKIKHHLTYGGGPEGGLVRFVPQRNHVKWFVWRRDWGLNAIYRDIPSSLRVVYKSVDGCESAKLVLHDYETQEDEYYWDDLFEGEESDEEKNDEADESEEEDDSEYDYDAHCDCCVELWEDCQWWCSNCGDEYPTCSASCYG